MKEVWKDVVGYEGFYEVSNLGRVRSVPRTYPWRGTYHTVRGRILKTHPSADWYPKCHINNGVTRKRAFVHRLVAEAFLPNPRNLPQVNHKDGNKKNSRVDNLEWCDGSTNCTHALKTGLRTPVFGEKSGRAKFKDDDIREIRRMWRKGKSQSEMARHYGVAPRTIGQIVNRETWLHID